MGSINWISGAGPVITSAPYRLQERITALQQATGSAQWLERDRHLPPASQYIWYLSCVESGGDDQPVTEIAGNRTDIGALAPMRPSHTLLGRRYLLGADELAEPGDLLYRDRDSLRSVLDLLIRQKSPVTLSRMWADSPTVELLRGRLALPAVVVTRPLSGCPYIDFDGRRAVGDFGLSKRLISDLRRARRKAESLGRLEFEVHRPYSEDQFLSLYEHVLAVEAAGWKGRVGSALKHNPWQREFFRNYGIHASRAGMLRVALLRIDGEPVAVQLAVVSRQRYWLLKIGYDESYARCSPGLLLVYETLRYAVDNDMTGFEFLGSAECWTRRWTDTERATVHLDIYPFSGRGMLALVADCLRYLGRKFCRWPG